MSTQPQPQVPTAQSASSLLLLEKLRKAKEQSGKIPWGWVLFALLVAATLVVGALWWFGLIRSLPLLGTAGKEDLSLRISRPRSLGTDEDIHHLHISEVEVRLKNGSLATLSCADPCINPMGPHPGAEPEKAFDGDVVTTYHNRYEGQYDEPNPYYGTEDHFLHVKIVGAKVKGDIAGIKIHHSHPQRRRVLGSTIELLKDAQVVWQSTFDESKETERLSEDACPCIYEFAIA